MTEKKMKLTGTIHHGMQAFNTLEEVPDELRKGFEAAGFIVEDVPEAASIPETEILKERIITLEAELSIEKNRADLAAAELEKVEMKAKINSNKKKKNNSSPEREPEISE